MSVETAAVVWDDETVSLHRPEGSSAAAIPDTQSLWDVVSEGKERVSGIAHTHPGRGYPAPSDEDLTTFRAIEKGLGRRIKWWILTSNRSVLLEWSGHGISGYGLREAVPREREPAWMDELRRASYSEVELSET
jgi:proteasome lid subunit RPN8/RPN11